MSDAREQLKTFIASRFFSMFCCPEERVELMGWAEDAPMEDVEGMLKERLPVFVGELPDTSTLAALNNVMLTLYDGPVRDNAKAFARGWLFSLLHPDADVEALVGWIDTAPLRDVVDFISG